MLSKARHAAVALATGTFVIALALSSGCAATGNGTSDDGAAPQSPAETSKPADSPLSPPSPGTGEGRPAGCSTNDTDQAVPTKSPADLTWMTYQTSLLPASPTAGPLKVDGPVWSCFARTPLGAVIAVHAISSKMGGSDWKLVAEKQIARGAGRDEFVARRSKIADEDETGTPGRDGSYLGFRILNASRDQVTLAGLIRLAEGQYGSFTASAVWEDGDWKLRPTLTGSITESMSQVNGPEGFTLWGGSSSS